MARQPFQPIILLVEFARSNCRSCDGGARHPRRSVYPGMAHWFNPILLGKLLLNVIISQTFGQYADRRLMVAGPSTLAEASESPTVSHNPDGAAIAARHAAC